MVHNFTKIRRFIPDTPISSIDNNGQWRSVIGPIFLWGHIIEDILTNYIKHAQVVRHYYLR